MARSRTQAENKKDGEEEKKPGPKQARKKRADDKNIEIKIDGVSGVKGNFQVAAGDIYNESTPHQIDSEYEASDVAKLNEAIVAKRTSLITQTLAQPELKSSHTAPLKFNEGRYLVGRNELLDRLVQKMEDHRTVILSGVSGIGKTSLVQAGLVPRLLQLGYLPVPIDVDHHPLPAKIKVNLMTGVEKTKYLGPLGLAKFLEHAAQALGPQGRLLLFLDGYENLFEQSQQAVDEFISQWEQSRDTLRVKWLFSIDRGYIASIDSIEDGEEVELPPIDRLSAAEAIQSIEAGPRALDEEDLKEILDRLESHREALQGAKISPSELQIVMQALAKGSPEKSLSNIYEDTRGLNGIFETHLTNILTTKFKPPERRTVRQVLTVLEDRYGTAIPLERILSRIESDGWEDEQAADFLARLKRHRILAVRDHTYELAGIHMKWAAQSWLNQQTLLDQAQDESRRQLDRIRTSALRGLIAGGLALTAFRWIVGTPVRDAAAVVFYSLLYAAMGGMTGLLFTFLIDIFLTRNQGGQPWKRYALSAGIGLVTFAAALALYAYLGEIADGGLIQLILATVVGGAWGAVTGLGIAWALGYSKGRLWSAPLVALLSSGTLYLFNLLFPVLRIATPLETLLGGFLFPLVIVFAVLYRRFSEPAWEAA